MDVPGQPLAQALEAELQRIPKVSGPGYEAGNIYLSQELSAALDVESGPIPAPGAVAGDPPRDTAPSPAPEAAVEPPPALQPPVADLPDDTIREPSPSSPRGEPADGGGG